METSRDVMNKIGVKYLQKILKANYSVATNVFNLFKIVQWYKDATSTCRKLCTEQFCACSFLHYSYNIRNAHSCSPSSV